MTVKEIIDLYDIEKNMSIEEIIERCSNGEILSPIYKKHLDVCWVIQDIYGHVEAEVLSQGKARELVAFIIEKQVVKFNSK